jgi:hypothetical protein
MAGGGLIQLVSIGAQDVYLVGNPQITFFKVTYQRHTNFARECIEQTIQGTQGFNQRLTITVSRSGDLVGPMHVEIALPALSSNVAATEISVYNSQSSALSLPTTGNIFNWCWVNYIGYRLLKEITIEIGGQPIDRHYSTWFYMWFELSTPAAKREGLQKMVGGYDVTEVPLGLTTNALVAQTLYVPLVFWFNTHPGLALPLIALQYHEVKLYIQTETLANCVVLMSSGTATTPGSSFSSVLDIEWNLHGGSNSKSVQDLDGKVPTLTLSVWADYYYLDSEERRRFAQLSHEYLIKQVQQITTSFSSFTDKASNQSIDYRTFNHPVSFNVWGFRKTANPASIDWTNFTNSPPFLQFLGLSIVDQHKLVLNGNDRYNDKNADYYNLVQPYNHFTAIPPVGLLCYSYALQPVEHQPSGSLNFSRIDNASNRFSVISDVSQLNGLLGLTGGSTNVWSQPKESGYEGVVYAVNYNVLRIMSGMGGLAYSN